MSFNSALVANNLLGWLVHLVSREVSLRPIEFLRKVANDWQTQVLRTNHTFNMDTRTFRTKRTKPNQVVFAYSLKSWNMRKLALLSHLTKSSLEIRTLFCFLKITNHSTLLRCWMPINTWLLLWTVAVLLPKSANWNFRLVVHMEVIAPSAPNTFLFDPMDTH